jgi:inosine-uridine nucleoside N-ribohydrolase
MLKIIALSFLLLIVTGQTANAQEKPHKIPVILDTDIGADIDDTWALALLLGCPEFDIKLIVSDKGDTTYRAKLIAKMLEVAKRTDIPVGVGIPLKALTPPRQEEWLGDYRLDDYPGAVHKDGVGAIIDTIMKSPEPITLICIGPVPNIAEALKREPRIAENARFVGMHGSIYKGYNDSLEKVGFEYNVTAHPKACQKAFTAPWDITITPLDTCGCIVLKGEGYKKVRDCQRPLIKALVENYRIWFRHMKWEGNAPETKSSVLFDLVAIYLAISEDYLVMKDLGVRVTDKGKTVVDDSAKHMNVAVEWKDKDAFYAWLVERLVTNR